MSGVFLKSQKINRVQRPKDRSELEFGLFSSISEAEVTGTGGQGTIRVVRIGNDYNDQGEVEVMMLSPYASYKPVNAGGDNIDSFEDTNKYWACCFLMIFVTLLILSDTFVP